MIARTTYDPSPSEGFNVIFCRVLMLGHETLFDGFPVAQELFPPALEGLDIVWPYALNSFHLECTLRPGMNRREKLVDRRQVSSREDVFVEKSSHMGQLAVDLSSIS